MKVITICGSFKFRREMIEVAEQMTLKGNCILMPNDLSRPNKESYTEEEAIIIDQMHKEKIKLSDSILVLNKDNYIGNSTKSEIEYAKSLNKEIIYYTDIIEEK